MTLADRVRTLLPLGVKFAYNLDGGGSRSTILKNKKIDPNIDNSGTIERAVPAYLSSLYCNSSTFSLASAAVNLTGCVVLFLVANQQPPPFVPI